MERVSIGPLGSCFRSFPPGDETFSSFQNGKKPLVNFKPPVPFPPPIKWKEYQLDPLGAAFAASLRGIKHFQDFKKAAWNLRFWKCQHPSLDTIKWKYIKWTPLGSAFAESLRGINNLGEFHFLGGGCFGEILGGRYTYALGSYWINPYFRLGTRLVLIFHKGSLTP